MLQQNSKPDKTKRFLENIYKKFNCREYVSPDPLQFLYNYKNVRDREIVGLIASALAYGRVSQIIKSTAVVLEKLGPSPLNFLNKRTRPGLKKTFEGFKHRFTTGEDIGLLLFAVKNIIKKYGSLYGCFHSGVCESDSTAVSALTAFVDNIRSKASGIEGHMIPSPERGSACKRLNLYLRWMIRKDDVDPGGWQNISPAILVIPLDTHMFRIGCAFGFTKRKQADLKAALEITEGFRRFSPEDPVKYDFALTRFGIRDDLELNKFLGIIRKRSEN